MESLCPECAAPLPEGGACLDHFHAMLYLESEAAAALPADDAERGRVAHFYAVSAYVLQHPESMHYTAEALAGLRRSLADHLAGRVSLEGVKYRVRSAASGAARVTRRGLEQPVRWPASSWPVTVADVLAGGAEGYVERVAAWAESVLRTLDQVAGSKGSVQSAKSVDSSPDRIGENQ